ncbi:MAG: sigma-70 family RNA polymerase sigma factor [Candidatus Limnocylindrales bacterium]|nr:sigma-70 family RNA polymerase sigma factor [Candidatus Limnocylindrales bacterium]
MQVPVVERAQRGDPDAFEVLVRDVGGRLVGLAFRILRDHSAAEDAVQQTLVTAWRELPGLRDPERFEAWLHRILVRACAAEARRNGRMRAGVRDVSPDVRFDSNAFGRVADRDELERGFRRLTPDQRTVVVLRYWGDLRQEEIAETMGIPLGTVKSRLHHATAALRAALEAEARPLAAEEGLA